MIIYEVWNGSNCECKYFTSGKKATKVATNYIIDVAPDEETRNEWLKEFAETSMVSDIVSLSVITVDTSEE